MQRAGSSPVAFAIPVLELPLPCPVIMIMQNCNPDSTHTTGSIYITSHKKILPSSFHQQAFLPFLCN